MAIDPLTLIHRFRTHCVGTLLADSRPAPLRFVRTPQGRIVLGLPTADTPPQDPVLFIPHEADDALQALLTDPAEPADADTLRWEVYHGPPRHPRWASYRVDSVRVGSAVADAHELALANPLADAEPALCRAANARPDALARATERAAGLLVQAPVAVGVDQFGLHVRGRFDVLWIPFPRPARDVEDARSLLDSLLDTAP